LYAWTEQKEDGMVSHQDYHSPQSAECTGHARRRMSMRGISSWMVEQVLIYGRVAHVRSAVVYAIGKKEVQENGRFLEACKGIHVLCVPDSGAVITTYRNHSLKGLKQ